MILVLTYDLSFKVIGDFEGQTYTNGALSALVLHVEMQYVLTSYYMKSWPRNPLVILVLTLDILFKVICDFQGQTYTKHAISALSLSVEMQYVLRSHMKSWSRNPLMIIVLTYDLSFKVTCDFEGQTHTKHAISA